MGIVKFDKILGDIRENDDSKGWLTQLPKFFNGTFVESFDCTAASAGGVITASLEKAGTGDLTMNFSTGQQTLDCTPAKTIVLTAGSDASPQANYVYVLLSAPTVLTLSTSAWPTTVEHIKVCYFLKFNLFFRKVFNHVK